MRLTDGLGYSGRPQMKIRDYAMKVGTEIYRLLIPSRQRKPEFAQGYMDLPFLAVLQSAAETLA